MDINTKINELFSLFDWIIFFSILIGTFLMALFGSRKKEKLSSDSTQLLDLLLMGRKLTLPLFVATLVATWYGGIFGVAQIAYENGIYNFITQGFFWYLTYLIFAFFLVGKISKFQAVTLPDLVGKMFGPKSEILAAVFNIFNLVPIAYTISIGLFLQLLFGTDLFFSSFLGLVFVLGYSLFGGFRSVVYSDIIQFFVMTSAVVLVFVISVGKFGFSPLSTLPNHYFHPLGKYSFLECLSWGLIALSTLVDPNFYQRCFAAVNEKVAKKGIIISTIIWMIFDISLTIGAMYAKATMENTPSEQAYFLYGMELLPNGLKGFFLAGVCATILSTLDSYLFLAGSTLSFDLLSKKFKNKIHTHYLSIVLIAFLSLGLSIVFEGNIKNVWKSLGSLSSSALLIPILAGHIVKTKMTDNDFIIISLAGATTAFIWRLTGLKNYYSLDEIYPGVLTSLIVLGLTQLKKKINKTTS